MDFKQILEESHNKKNIPNKKLIEMMDFLANQHDDTKKNLINLSHYLDKIEETYNSLLNEFESRKV